VNVTKHQQQADSELHEDQLVNFLVKLVDEGVTLNLANNAEIDTEDLDLDALQLQSRLAIGEHDPLSPQDEVRAGTARTSR